MDQLKRQLSGLEKRVQEVEKSLHEATQKLDHLNQRLSDPGLYLNQQETYETVQTHKQVKEQVTELTQRLGIPRPGVGRAENDKPHGKCRRLEFTLSGALYTFPE